MKDFFKTTFACVLAMVIAGIVLIIAGTSIIAGALTSSDGKGEIERNSVLFLDLNGAIEERTDGMLDDILGKV